MSPFIQPTSSLSSRPRHFRSSSLRAQACATCSSHTAQPTALSLSSCGKNTIGLAASSGVSLRPIYHTHCQSAHATATFLKRVVRNKLSSIRTSLSILKIIEDHKETACMLLTKYKKDARKSAPELHLIPKHSSPTMAQTRRLHFQGH